MNAIDLFIPTYININRFFILVINIISEGCLFMISKLFQSKIIPVVIAVLLIIGVLGMGTYTFLNNGGNEDDEKPTIQDMTKGTPHTGSPFKVTAEISDNNGIDSVWLDYKLTAVDGTRSTYNQSMDSSDEYSYNVDILDNSVKLDYTILAKDKSDNWNKTSNSLEVIDNIDPDISDSTSESPIAGENFKIISDVTDNIKVDSVFLNYNLITDGYSQNYNKSMDYNTDYSLEINLWKNSTILDYTILGKDTSNNWKIYSNSLKIEKPDYMFGWSVGDPDNDYGTIIHTDDGGNTWERQGNNSTIPNTSLSQIRAMNRSTAWIVGGKADGYGTILKTTNGGLTWNRIMDESIPNADIEGIAIIDKDTVWAVGQNNTILVTHDGGESWESKSNSFYDSYALSDVVAVDENNIWICGGSVDNHGLILHSRDGGESWTQEGKDLLSNHSLISLSIVDEDRAWAIGGGSTVMKTIDGGDTWKKVGESTFPSLIDGNGICALDNNTVWVVLDYDNIYKTIDNGENWTQQESNSTGYYLLRVTAINETNAWVTGSSQFPPIDGVLLHTTDGGKTWNKVEYGLNSGLWDVYFVDAYH